MTDSYARERLSDQATLNQSASGVHPGSAESDFAKPHSDTTYARDVMSSINSVTDKYRSPGAEPSSHTIGSAQTLPPGLSDEPQRANLHSSDFSQGAGSALTGSLAPSSSTGLGDTVPDLDDKYSSGYGINKGLSTGGTGETIPSIDDVGAVSLNSTSASSTANATGRSTSTEEQKQQIGRVGERVNESVQQTADQAREQVGPTSESAKESAQQTADKVSRTVEKQGNEANLGAVLPDVPVSSQPPESNSAPEHVNNLATALGGVAISAPLAAIEKVSPAVASKLSQGAQAAAGMASNAIDTVAPHAANATEQVKGVAGSTTGNATSFVQRAVETAKAYLPGGASGATTGTGGSHASASETIQSTAQSTSNDLAGDLNNRSSTAAPDVLSSKDSFTPPS